MKHIISFLGLPGSGKGTQAAMVTKKLGIPSYSIGQVLRDVDDPVVKEYIDAGLIVPDNVVNKVVEDLMKSLDNACLLDGYPRSMSQAKFLHDAPNIDVLPIYFKLDEEDLLDRITSRIQCSECDSIYNDDILDEGDFSCQNCGAKEYYRRKDDNKEILAVRIEQFKANTVPVLDFYESKNLLHTLDAKLSIGALKKDIVQIVEEFIP